MEDKIIDIIRKKGGKAKTMTVYFMSGCRQYSDFSILVDRLVKMGKIKRIGEYGEYLEVVYHEHGQ